MCRSYLYYKLVPIGKEKGLHKENCSKEAASFMQNNDSYWWYITFSTVEGQEDILHSLADISGSIGADLQELPDGGARLRAYYRANESLSHWKKALIDAMGEWNSVKIEDFGKLENQPWNVQAQEAFPPLPVGKNLVVLAPWHKGTESRDRIPLYINPGSAFGTGYHESTRIALRLMEEYMKPGMVSADIGTGSGILAVAAQKLGASKSYARDIDPAVLNEVRKNFELNGIDGKDLDLKVGDMLKGFSQRADILTANILLDPLLTMVKDVPKVIGKNGVAIFSGMLIKEKAVFLKCLEDTGMEVLHEAEEGEWWGVAAKNKT